jgi:hypothetical protein
LAEKTLTLPSAVTREQRRLRISVRITDPSAIATGPSGKPSRSPEYAHHSSRFTPVGLLDEV